MIFQKSVASEDSLALISVINMVDLSEKISPTHSFIEPNIVIVMILHGTSHV